jgi:hypothetical protein
LQPQLQPNQQLNGTPQPRMHNKSLQKLQGERVIPITEGKLK